MTGHRKHEKRFSYLTPVAKSGDTPVDPNRLIVLRQVQELVPLHSRHIGRLVERGEFPKPVYLGRRLAWVEQEVRDWIQEQAAQRTRAG